MLGAGIGLREELKEKTLEHKDAIDVLEVISELFVPGMSRERKAFLDTFSSAFPIIPHGVGLSIGTAQPVPEKKLADMRWLCDYVNAPYYSEHFSLTNDPAESFSIGHLSPIWFTDEELGIVVSKIHQLQKYLGRPIVLENITSLFELPESDYTESEFITKVCENTDVGLLLDVTNAHINAYNRKQDPLDFIAKLPLERVVQMHLAGGELHHEWFYDTHSQELTKANEPIWNLFSYAVARTPNLRAVIIERDGNFKEDFDAMLLKDLRRIREIWAPAISSSAKAPQIAAHTH